MDYESGDEIDMFWLTQNLSQENIESSNEDSDIDVVGTVPSLETNENVHSKHGNGFGYEIQQFTSPSCVVLL